MRGQLPNFRGTVLDIGCGYKPYKSLLLTPPSQAQSYIGLDLADNIYEKPDLQWDGQTIPLGDGTVDSALATEVFEHCPEPEVVMRETLRVLKPGGFLFFTVPFLWPLHCVPNDEYRYTPFALQRHLKNAGFEQIQLRGLGGWDASLAQLLGLWICRRVGSLRKRAFLGFLAMPFIRYLLRRDEPPEQFTNNLMLTGISGTARRPS